MPGLAQELKMTRPFATVHEEAFLNLMRTADQLQIEKTRLFREYGLTEPQYNVLRILRGADGPLPCLEVAARMVTIVPAITGLVGRLERDGLVRRDRSSEDRRVVYVSITRTGMALLRKLDEPVRALDRALLSHLSERELRQLIALTTKARARCTESRYAT